MEEEEEVVVVSRPFWANERPKRDLMHSHGRRSSYCDNQHRARSRVISGTRARAQGLAGEPHDGVGPGRLNLGAFANCPSVGQPRPRFPA